jgi:hypothetical protein
MSASTYADASLSREAQRYVAKRNPHALLFIYFFFLYTYACIFRLSFILSYLRLLRLPTGICA